MEYFDYDAAAKYFLNQSRSGEIDIQRLLEWSQQSESERIEQELERIKRELEERDTIHQVLVEELEKKVDWYVDQLRELYTRFSPVDEDKSTRLKSEISSFYRELRRVASDSPTSQVKRVLNELE